MKVQPTVYLLFIFIFSNGVPATDNESYYSGIEGEYRGTVKKVEMTLWATPVTGPGGAKVIALMFFPSTQRQVQTDRLRRLTDALLTSRQHWCDIEDVFNRMYRPGSSARAGLVLIHGGWDDAHSLKPDWRSVTPKSYLMSNDEYIFLSGREYMVKEVRRDPGDGELIDLRLTQTGFIQNFFDNPRLRLARIETASAELELLAGYVNAKFAAHNALNAALEGVPQESVPPCP